MLTFNKLMTEYAVNPIGIDEPAPRFSWALENPQEDTRQMTYHIEVASTPELLSSGKADMWDSQSVASSQSVNIEYAGRPLASGARYYWRVRAADNHNNQAQSDGSDFFEMGLLKPQDWKARWLAYPGAWTGKSLLLRHGFDISKPVRRARMYAAGLGYYEPRLNGAKVGDQVLEPAWTTYSKRVLYRTYDITSQIQQGRNVVGAIVGHGWYGGTRLLMQLMIEFTDGTSACIPTGWNWFAAPGPIQDDSVYDGETYDARNDHAGWDTAEGETRAQLGHDKGWFYAVISESPGGKLAAAALEPIRVVQTLRPQSFKRLNDTTHVVDFGQNFAGWARIRVNGPSGTCVTLRFAESLHDDGSINQENLRLAKAQDTYILKGNGIEEWEARFTYHGFRYVQIQNWPGELTAGSIDGRVVRSDVGRRGAITTDHELINQIQRAIEWTEGSNLHSIPTDCPQRDERLGWLNDMTARAEEAIYNYDMIRFFTKWLDDIADTQDENGAIPDTVPYRFCNQPADPVCICYLLLPWLLYQHYGDKRLLQRHYQGMKNWVRCLGDHSDQNIVNYSYWGDWAPPIERKGLPFTPTDTAVNLTTPGELVSTAFYAYASQLLSRIAGVIGNHDDQRHYKELAAQITDSFNRKFWNNDCKSYSAISQSCNILPLYFGMVPQELMGDVVNAIVHDIQNVQGGHLATGNICTKYLPEVLTDTGHAEIAYQIATKQTYPSWGFMLANGATTMWERWEKACGGGMNSHNHPMLGSISAWFYRALAGLRIESSASGCSDILIQPSLVSGINQASASLQTIRGEVNVRWRRNADSFELSARIPVNAQAKVVLPYDLKTQVSQVIANGVAIWPADHSSPKIVHIEAHDSNQITLSTGSGSYAFKIKLRHA